MRQPLDEYAKTDPSVRVMEQRFMAIEQAMGTPKGRDAAAKFLKGFVEEMKKSGFVADALKADQPARRQSRAAGKLARPAEKAQGCHSAARRRRERRNPETSKIPAFSGFLGPPP